MLPERLTDQENIKLNKRGITGDLGLQKIFFIFWSDSEKRTVSGNSGVFNII